ncbi:tetratricopeptide repeat protein [Thermophilibacter immobilis]|uniref:Tetratricopeptide repeat protein n=1 Tax=Thermophilibacter immobilis TaxID=2779519 RepID=A0A7S7M956_9ACTN|nr:tetratricopeptide repeat protein [Thermophilibacter immobilis]QOY61047.1 tetratricopeptide repeat protein [Thermophilibacter immobilis]
MANTPRAKSKVAAAKKPPKAGAGAKAKDPGTLSRTQKVIVIVFVVIFAFSTLAGALASVSQSQESSASSSSTSTQDADASQVDAVDEKYQSIVSDLEAKLADDPADEASLLALGRYYFAWGANVSSVATTDDETQHANDLLGKSIGYDDQYLAQVDSDSGAVRVNRALAQYYEGDPTSAVTALEELTRSSPDYALAWANLGMLYESQGTSTQAAAAYQKAVEYDPDDEYGAKSYGEDRLSALEASASSASSSSDSSSSTSTTSSTSATGSGAAGLSSDLSNLSGTGL